MVSFRHGPGGGSASREASKSMQILCEQKMKKGMSEEEIRDLLRETFLSTTSELLKIAEKEHVDKQDYGTTAVVAVYDCGNPPKLVCFWFFDFEMD